MTPLGFACYRRHVGRKTSVRSGRSRKRIRALASITRASVAYHEAGHAVVALACGHRIDFVTIEDHEGFAGLVQAQGEDVPEDHVRVLLAGIGAEEIAEVAGHVPRNKTDGFRGDFGQALVVIRELVGDDEGACEARLHVERGVVSDLLHEEWTSVTILVAALLKHGTLTGAQVAELISASTFFTR